jgi:hypothetical protein
MPCLHTIIRALENINIEDLRKEFYKVNEKIHINKGFGTGIDGYIVCAIDGTGEVTYVFTGTVQLCFIRAVTLNGQNITTN